MRMYDLILKKRQGKPLTKDEIQWMIREYTDGRIPDYQMSALLMAICFQGLDKEETYELTMAMARSGEMLDLSQIQGIKVDKHSTGGVGDKTSLALTPIVASFGIPVAKMSGRGLGHTGGTIDKLESIPGFSTQLEDDTFEEQVNSIGISIMGQTKDLAPADKLLYALRDVTATVDQISLIASSIMSKKLAAGADAILLDVKTGSGAFMKTVEDSRKLAEKMVSIGTMAGRKCCAVITNMDIPLGHAIGNSLEVMEAIETLKGNGPADLTAVCLELAANMLYMAGKGSLEECRRLAEGAMADGSALDALANMVKGQHGDESYIYHPEKFPRSALSKEVKAEKDGYVCHMDTESIGIASVCLGAGRSRKDDVIDYKAGIILKKKYGEPVKAGETLAVLYADDEKLFAEAEKKLLAAYEIGDTKPAEEPLVYDRVTA